MKTVSSRRQFRRSTNHRAEIAGPTTRMFPLCAIVSEQDATVCNQSCENPVGADDSTYTSPGWRVTAQRNAAGQLTQMVVYQPNGTSETETFSYNGLGQLTQASGRGSHIEYRYSTTGNDGRITSRKDNISGEEVSYTYDQRGRLIAAATTGPEWELSWVYDGFGNRLQQNVTKGTGPSAVFAVDPATNRLSTAGTGVVYDANGSMTAFGTGAGTASYDVDNRMVSVSTSNGTEGYAYSVANQRLTATRPNGTVETFFYGLGGELLGVYQRGTKANGHKYFSSASIRVWFAGRLIGSGANSMVTDRLGSVVKSGTESLSFYPYGEQRTGNANGDREKFATYTRDAVSGLDYAQNRYYSSQFGRFTTADPYSASARAANNPAVPQSWNRYAYVLGNPVNLVDREGLQAQGPHFECPDYDPENWLNCEWVDPGPGGVPGAEPGKTAPPEDPGPKKKIGPPSGAQFDGFNEAYDVLKSKPKCAALIAGTSGMNADTLQTYLWNAEVTAGSSMPGNNEVVVEQQIDGYAYTYQTAYTQSGNIELNGNYFPDPTRQNINLPDGTTASFLQLVNGALLSNMNATQLGAFVFLHELSHIAGSAPGAIDTLSHNQSIISTCLN